MKKLAETIMDFGYSKNRNHYRKIMESNQVMSEYDIGCYIGERTINYYFNNEVVNFVKMARIKTGRYREGHAYTAAYFNTVEWTLIKIGDYMEKTTEELIVINEQVGESKKILQNLYNEIRSVHDKVEPELRKQIQEIRNTRMGIVSETQTMLTMLKDIRKFFLESDYEKEMSRLREFVSICKELEGMKKSGTLDAISDTIIKLSIKEGE